MVSIFKRKGRRGWTVQYLDRDGRRRQRTRKTKESATALRDHLERETLAAAGLAPDRPLSEYSKTWLGHASTNLRAGTIRIYRWAVERHIGPALGHLTLRAISRPLVKDLATSLVAGGLKKKSVANVIGTLHAILAEAVQDGILAANPAAIEGKSRVLRLAPTRAERRAKVKAMDLDQSRAFLAAADQVLDAGDALQLRILLQTGMRPGEGLALRWEDFDFASGAVEVRRTFTEHRIEPTKTSHERTVDLARGLVEHLESWNATSRAAALAAGVTRSEWVFPAKDGARVAWVSSRIPSSRSCGRRACRSTTPRIASATGTRRSS